MTFNERNIGDPDIASDLLAHDLRAAAAGVLSSLSLIGADGLSGAEKRSLRQARVAAATLKDLLDISMGVGVVSKNDIPLAELARRIDNRWRDTAVEKGVCLRITLSTDAPASVHAAWAELNRIFDNIIGNALKFCDEGEVRVHFHGTDDGGLIVIIDDDGPGFSDAALHALFSLRGRPADARKDGTGLGLFITKSLTDRFNGKIEVQNRPRGGARILLDFPCEMCRFDDAPANAPGAALTGGLPDLSALNILVAEDNLTNQLVVSQMLEAMGARYELASDGVEALEILGRGGFDIALLDIEMPRMTGLDVIRAIRARADALATVPLVALTAYAMPEHLKRIIDVGANGLIAKPLTSITDFGSEILSYVSGTASFEPAPKQAAPADLTAVDRRIFDSLAETMGPAGMRELLSKITIDLENVQVKLREGQAGEAVEPVRSATHILISLAGAIGGTGLQNLSQELNAAVKAEPWPQVAPRLDRLVEGVDELLTFVAKETGNW
ncbi:MAG: response regulator [Paracoccaceae bacterium]